MIRRSVLSQYWWQSYSKVSLGFGRWKKTFYLLLFWKARLESKLCQLFIRLPISALFIPRNFQWAVKQNKLPGSRQRNLQSASRYTKFSALSVELYLPFASVFESAVILRNVHLTFNPSITLNFNAWMHLDRHWISQSFWIY